jgi:hypothetical protein
MGRIVKARCTSGKAAGQKVCGHELEARMIQRAQTEHDSPASVIFAKSLAVLTCPVCDAPDTKHRITPPPHLPSP